MSPLDLSTRQANPTYTDPYLQVNTDPAYPGRICIFFQSETIIDRPKRHPDKQHRRHSKAESEHLDVTDHVSEADHGEQKQKLIAGQ